MTTIKCHPLIWWIIVITSCIIGGYVVGNNPLLNMIGGAYTITALRIVGIKPFGKLP